MQPITSTALHIQRLSSIRKWEDAHLPIYGSLLGRDLVLLLAQYHLEARRFTLKEVYYSLPYSENAVRRHLKRLLADGWISLGPPGPDRRFRFVIPSEKLQRAVERYLSEASII